jgi:hypothetical protein
VRAAERSGCGGMAKGGVEEKAAWHLTGDTERGWGDGGGGFGLALSGRKHEVASGRRRSDYPGRDADL